VDSGSKQRLVDVDVPHARQEALVHEQRFDAPRPLAQQRPECRQGERRFQRFGPELGDLREIL
jgi:hypothetical protein